MKITPIELRQKTFNKKFMGGIDPVEVAAFLTSLSQAWEKILAENKDLRNRLDTAERDANQFREYQSALLTTIKNAEAQSEALLEHTQEQANFMIREAKTKADAVIKDAERIGRTLKDEAEQHARITYSELKTEVSKLSNEYQQIESMRQTYLAQLRSFSNEIADRIRGFESKQLNANFELPNIPPHLPAATEIVEQQGPTPSEQPAIEPLRNKPARITRNDFNKARAARTSEVKQEDAPQPVNEVADAGNQPTDATDQVTTTTESTFTDIPLYVNQEPLNTTMTQVTPPEPDEDDSYSKSSTGGSFFDQFNS